MLLSKRSSGNVYRMNTGLTICSKIDINSHSHRKDKGIKERERKSDQIERRETEGGLLERKCINFSPIGQMILVDLITSSFF